VYERLWPDPAPMSSDDVAQALRAARPRLFLDMVSTVDGLATIGGRSGPIGGEADKEMFHLLRTVPDAVLVGTGTLRAERYGRLVRKPERRAARAAAGLAEDPIAVLMTRSGDIPWEAPLFDAPEQTVVIYTAREDLATPARTAAKVYIVSGTSEPAAVLEHLRSEFGVDSVLCEGGPHLNRSLLVAGVVDELFLTMGPLIAGGQDALTMVAGPPLPEPLPVRTRWILRAGEELFLRYGI
jgi:riboflavin-specific deaminase-like protein